MIFWPIFGERIFIIKKLGYSVAAVFVLTSAAFAADLPSRQAPAVMAAVPLAYSWTGAYVGADLGYDWGRTSTVDLSGYNAKGSVISHRDTGAQFNVHAGYNYQTGPAVFGIEGELGYFGLRGSRQYGPYVGVRKPDDSRSITKSDFYGALTGRIGFAPTERALLYVKGGFVLANLRNSYIDTDPTGLTLNSGTSTSRPRFGYTLGAGAEYAFTNNWSVLLEYDHYDFGKKTHVATASSKSPYAFSHKTTADTVRIGLNYKF